MLLILGEFPLLSAVVQALPYTGTSPEEQSIQQPLQSHTLAFSLMLSCFTSYDMKGFVIWQFSKSRKKKLQKQFSKKKKKDVTKFKKKEKKAHPN